MFVFPEQKSFNIGGVVFGGQLSNPCVLVGLIRFDDKKIRESLVQRQQELSGETGIPTALEICSDTEDGMLKGIDVCSEIMDGTAPFVMNSSKADVRVFGLKHAGEIGVADEVICKPINSRLSDSEANAIKEAGVNSAVFQMRNGLDKRLIKTADSCGIVKKIIGVDLNLNKKRNLLYAIPLIKAESGLPTGASSVLDYRVCPLLRLAGADYITYNIEYASEVFHATALTECLIGEAMEEIGLKLSKNHPYNRLC